MKFYSKITTKPNSIIKQVKNGIQVVSQKCICTFINGELETDDPLVISELESRKDLFRSDRPWKVKSNWRNTEEGKKLLEEGERLGIECRHIRECYLKQRIQEILHPVKKGESKAQEQESVDSQTPKVQAKIDYKEIVKLAKEKGIKTHKVKQEILKKKLKESGVNV